MRFEKPHSLSYHDETLTSQPETLVRVASKLKLCGGLGLIDAAHAGEVANAYRMFRKLQHQIRPHGHNAHGYNSPRWKSRQLRSSGCGRRGWNEIPFPSH